MKHILLKIILFILISGCGSDENPEPKDKLLPAGNLIVKDIANYGNGKDLELTFNKPVELSLVEEFRIYIVKTSNKPTFDSTKALSTGNNYLTLGKTSSSTQISFDENTVDVNGDPVQEEESYNLFILSLSTDESQNVSVLSIPSDDIVLTQKSAVRTLTDIIRAGSGGMDVDTAGNIYMADFGNSLSGPPGTKVYKITPEGKVSVFATGLTGASGNDFDNEGNLYQSNISIGTISKITSTGQVSTFAIGLKSPVGIVYDGVSNFYVCNCGNNTISRVDMKGSVSLFVSSGLLNCPNGIDMDNSGNLYVSNFSSQTLVKITPGGVASSFATMPGSNNGHLLVRGSLIYVIGRGLNIIYRVNFGGNVTVFAGNGSRGLGNGGLAESSFSIPNDLAFSPDGSKMYINDVAVGGTDLSIISPVVIRVIDIVN